MAFLNIQRQLLSRNILTPIIVNVICALIWFLPFIIGMPPTIPTTIISIFGSITIFTLTPFGATLIQYLLWILIGIFTNRVLERQKILPAYNYLFYYVFLIVGTITPSAQLFSNTSIAFVLILLAFYSTLTYNLHETSIFSTFNSFLLLSVSTIFNVEIIWILPCYWIVLILIQQFSFNDFITSLFSIFAVCCLIFGIGYLSDITNTIFSYYKLSNIGSIFNFTYFQQLSLINWIGISIAVIWFLIYFVVDYFHLSEYSISMRQHLNYYSIILLITILLYTICTSIVYKSLLILIFIFSFFMVVFYRKKASMISEIMITLFLLLGIIYRIVVLIL